MRASSPTPRALHERQALHERRPVRRDGLVHYPDTLSRHIIQTGGACVSICDTGRLAEAGIEPAVGRVGDPDNALAETINGLCKTGVIHRRGPWHDGQAVERATLNQIDVVQPSTAAGAHR